MMTSNVKTILHADSSQSENFIQIISFDVSRSMHPDELWSCELRRSTLPKTYTLITVKVKQSRYRTGVAQRVPGRYGSQIS
jgi:hypothetical protein